MNTIDLSNVTLCAVACTKVDASVHALKHSLNGIRFAETLLITHEKRTLAEFGITVTNIEKLDYKGYNHFVLYRLKDYIKTDYCLLVQNDGYVLRPDKWSDNFYKYDYIGAPWAKNTHFTSDGTEVRVGNGGFSFRSKKLLHAPGDLKLEFTDKGTGFFHEDGFISVYYRKALEQAGIKIAPVEVASRFSREVTLPDSVKYPFGFHNIKNIPRLLPLRPLAKKIHIEI